jgi:hypothetical protein
VLEAIAVVGLGYNADQIAALLVRRGGPPLDALEHVVRNGADYCGVEIHGALGGSKKRWLTKFSTTRSLTSIPVDQDGKHMKGAVIELEVQHDTGDGVLQDASAHIDWLGRQSTYGVGHWKKGLAAQPFAVKLVDVEAVRAGGALEDAYSRIEQAGKIGTVVRALGRSMPGLTDLRILKVDTNFILNAFCGGQRPVPAYLAGDGFKRFLELAAAAVDTPDGVVLLEEPETYQHPRYLQEIATLLHLVAKGGTQIILSTHSIELIDLLLHAPEAEGLPYPAVHRMGLFEGRLRATSIDREKAIIARDELLEDLRA